MLEKEKNIYRLMCTQLCHFYFLWNYLDAKPFLRYYIKFHFRYKLLCLIVSSEQSLYRFHKRWCDNAETSCTPDHHLQFSHPLQVPLHGGISLQIFLLREEDLEILVVDTQWDMGAVTHRHLCFGRTDLYFA
jgi:hypothetical protein